MSLEYLPNELLNSILHYTTKAELFALSLVSKRLSLYARPLARIALFRVTRITISTFSFDLARQRGCPDSFEKHRDRFIQVFESDPSCASFIQTLH